MADFHSHKVTVLTGHTPTVLRMAYDIDSYEVFARDSIML